MKAKRAYRLWCVFILGCAGWSAQESPRLPSAEVERAPGLYATLNTSMGEVVVNLFEKEAPITVRNFLGLALGTKTYIDPRTGLPAKKPFYDGTTFHRVVPGFVIQGGDPTGSGFGVTKPIPDEILQTLRFDVPGRLAMASLDRGPASCQFFITDAPQPHLNGTSTIFGQVVKGQEVVAAIARVPAKDSRPNTPVYLRKVIIQRIGNPLPDFMPKIAAEGARREIDFPSTVVAHGEILMWSWKTVFSEKSGGIGYWVEGESGYVHDRKGKTWVSSLAPFSHSLTRSAVKVPPGGKAVSTHWIRSKTHNLCNGIYVMQWKGQDSRGQPVEFGEGVYLLHKNCPRQIE